MEELCLVATHLSSVNTGPTAYFNVQTQRQNAPLPSPIQDNDFPADHATCSQALTTPTTGTILLRLIQGGVVVELTALSAPVPPLRVIFPATVIPNPTIFLWKETELHLLAVTDIGSLHRIVIPLDGFKLWQDQTENIWPREYFISNLPSESIRQCFAHAQGTHSIAIALPSGVLLRIEAESMGYDGQEEEWIETVFHYGSFLSSLTSYLPLNSGIPGSSDIISLATHQWPTDIGHVWSLSRDRTLRLWKAKLGCVASKALPSVPNSRDPSTSSSASAKYLLLDDEQQSLLKIFSVVSEEYERVDIYALAFIPISSSTTGGFFVVVDSSSDHLVEVGNIECPKHTAHCHLQDFVVHEGTLYTLWDRQGQSMVERAVIDVEGLRTHNLPPAVWKESHYAHQPELTPAYMEEQLLSTGSLTEKFLNAIMKPGVFSSLTLRTALDRYIDACLSLPGPPPPQLVNTYSSLCEHIAAVVGCTVTLNRDPQTGGFQHANYWTALKRDWEGFVARCRDVERSARWPIAIGSYGANGILVVERERIGSLIVEDQPIAIRRMLEVDQQLHPDHTLLAILWNLRSKLGPRTLSTLESRIIDLMHQEIAFSFAEILQDSARRLNFHEALDDGAQEWFAGRLQSVGDLDAATRITIDCLGGFDLAVKREEMEVEFLTLPPASEWLLAQAAAYSTTTVEARYDLSLCLIILLFFLADELQSWDPSLLAEVFAVFRGVAMLRSVCAQPSESGQSGKQGSSSADDVIAQMHNMNVSTPKSQNPFKSSLIHLLVGRSPAADGIASTAHNFLDSTGVLRSLSPARTTKHEVLFADQIKSLGFIDITRELLSSLPRTPAATFLQSQVLLKLGRVDDAAQLLETLAGCIGIPNMTLEDAEALGAVIPSSHAIQTEYAFYLFAAELFHNVYLVHEVRFSQLAIQVAPSSSDTVPLWNNVVKGLTEQALYEDAYATVMQIPYDNQKRELASQLAIHMCEENAVEKLMAFDFAGIAGEVEAALAFKARNADPRSKPSYPRILYTWYTRRGDYRNASLTMYQRARRLYDVIVDPTSFVSLAEDQLEALSVAINSLYLVEEKAQWILVPVVPDPARKRQKLSRHIPDSKYISSKYDAEIIHLSDMEYDCTLLRAQIDSIKREPSLLSSPEYLLPPSVIVMRLAQANQYNQAMSIAQSLKVDMTEIFILLTNQCIRLSRNPGAILEEDTSGWLLTDNASSWQGTPSDRGWRYLQRSLKRYDGQDSDYRYAKASLESILSIGRSLSPPPWLIDILDNHHPEYLIRISLRYENIADAVNYTYALILKSDKNVARETAKNAATTWLPYALIDQVLSAGDAQMKQPPNLTELRTEVNNRVKRMQKFSQNVA
ncbi:nucleoporin Nup120/160-domain-containing protein [Crepidotus variabilis]|uniref:Nucleoporin Nup120/160-domain-containing protein n=1 Tax=Crepidotus variabilis TaxID=179855 RepID=A0A9P6JV48_9AGAR|nr:nucleoporin Nup120/160-domain-containing protein [Crepidotus variabilis]